jgi:DNA-binding response OmpR family regulator
MNGTIGPGPGTLSNARIAIAEGDDAHRTSLAETIRAIGCPNIHEFASLAELKQGMSSGECRAPDLLILDQNLTSRIGDFIDALRHGRVGNNPFVVVIITCEPTDGRQITSLLRQGADDVVVKPISSRTLMERIEYVAVHRRPFIVTSNYVGPDRRIDDDRPTAAARFQVPNTLLQHLTGDHGSGVNAADSIRETVEAIVSARLEQHAQSLGVLSHLLLEAHFGRRAPLSGSPLPARAWFNVMLSLLRDVQRIGNEVRNPALVELAKTLRQQIQTLARRHDSLHEQDVNLLKDLSEAVTMTIGMIELPNPDITGLARTYQKHGQQPKPPQGPIVVPRDADASADD